MTRFALALLLSFVSTNVMASDAFVFLVDSSGSMSDNMGNKTRAKVAQESIIAVSADIPEGAYVGVLSFHGWVYKPAPLDKAQFARAVNSMDFGGRTPLGKYTKTAADELLLIRSKGDRGGEYTLIIVTDGQEQDTGKLQRYIPEILGRGLVVKAIGLDFPGSHTLSDKSSGVEYTKAGDEGSLQKELKRHVSAEGDFSDPQETADMFDELDGLPGEFAFGLIGALTENQNQPIGEPRVIQVRDEQGNLKEVPNLPGLQPANTGLGFFGWVGIIFGVVIAFVVFVKLITS